MRMSRGSALRLTYAACLLGTSVNHWLMIRRHGLLWDYGGVPWPSAWFWTSLAFADPAAAILLLVRPEAGVAATVAIIVADVAHNLWIVARRFPLPLRTAAATPELIAQVVFMAFVLATARIARRVRRDAG